MESRVPQGVDPGPVGGYKGAFYSPPAQGAVDMQGAYSLPPVGAGTEAPATPVTRGSVDPDGRYVPNHSRASQLLAQGEVDSGGKNRHHSSNTSKRGNTPSRTPIVTMRLDISPLHVETPAIGVSPQVRIQAVKDRLTPTVLTLALMAVARPSPPRGEGGVIGIPLGGTKTAVGSGANPHRYLK